jgi:hypothetical protein
MAQYKRKISPLLTGESESQQVGQKHSLSPAAGQGVYNYNNTGLFNVPGQDSNIFSAMTLPEMGLIDALPIMPAGYSDDRTDRTTYGGVDSPYYTLISGVTQGASESLANQRSEPCSPAPLGGTLKVGTLTAFYGLFSQGVKPLDVRKAGRLMLGNGAEPINSRVVNNPFDTNWANPSQASQGIQGVPKTEIERRLFEASVSQKRYVAQKVYTGTPSNNNVGGGYREFLGLDYIINEGNKVDAFTGQVITAANSVVEDFGNDLVTGSGRDIVEYLESVMSNLIYNARQMGFGDSVQWAAVMSPSLFDQLIQTFPVRAYQAVLTTMAQYANGRAMVDARDATAMQSDMRNGLYIPIPAYGQMLPVILDDGIPENNSTNSTLTKGRFSSDIYIVPLEGLGQPLTYWETLNYDNSQVAAIRNLGGDYASWRVSDGGRFLWTKSETNGCIGWAFEFEPRLICRTPFLAARINDVAYEPLRHFRSAFPDSPYFLNGGRTNMPQVKIYTDWSPTTPVPAN